MIELAKNFDRACFVAISSCGTENVTKIGTIYDKRRTLPTKLYYSVDRVMTSVSLIYIHRDDAQMESYESGYVQSIVDQIEP